MLHNRLARGAVCLALAAPVSAAMAGSVEFEFTGTVDLSLDNTPVSAGDTFTGRFSYDTRALLTGGDGVYEAFGTNIILSFIVEFHDGNTGELIQTFDFGPQENTPGLFFDRFLVLNDFDKKPGLFDAVSLRDTDTFDGKEFHYEWNLSDQGIPPDALDDVSVPTILNFDDWDRGSFFLQGPTNTGLPYIYGDIETFTQLILTPLPAPVWIGSLGLLAVFMLRRRIL